MAGCFGDIVANALLAPEGSQERQVAERQMECKMVAMHQMLCPCGDVLDQETVCVLRWADTGKLVAACCPNCRSVAEMPLVKLYRQNKLNGELVWLTWDACEQVVLDRPAKRISAVKGLEIVLSPQVSRGKGKHQVLHVESGRLLSEHSSRAKAQEMLAAVDGLVDWTLPYKSLRDAMSLSMKRHIAGLVQIYK